MPWFLGAQFCLALMYPSTRNLTQVPLLREPPNGGCPVGFPHLNKGTHKKETRWKWVFGSWVQVPRKAVRIDAQALVEVVVVVRHSPGDGVPQQHHQTGLQGQRTRRVDMCLTSFLKLPSCQTKEPNPTCCHLNIASETGLRAIPITLAKLNLQDNEERTALMRMIPHEKVTGMPPLLIEEGARVNIPDNTGEAPLT